MLNEKLNSLFQAIKEDNDTLFVSSFKGNESICFGRFPVLSLCYLYKAKKILRKYKKELLVKIVKYKVVGEPFEIYTIFKSKAGRSLRLYTAENIVTPIEMLAILNKDWAVKNQFKNYKKDEKVIQNLKTIYLINCQRFEVSGNKIKIGKKPLNLYQTKLRKIALYSSLAIVLCISVLFTTINFTTGFGVSFSPFIISSEAQFYKALSSDGHYKLVENIVINKPIENLNFSGYLDGNNHTIYFADIPDKNIIKENNGTIQNLNIVYNNSQKEISTSLSLFVEKNNGNIQNINISCQDLNLTVNKKENENIFINAIANSNNGSIKNCNVLLNLNVTGLGNGECYVSGIAGTNCKTIDNCTIKQNSSLTSTETDVTGIVYSNEKKGVISNCKNYALLQQTSADINWSPNVSGIALTNYSTIKDCYNYGALTATSTYESTEVGGSVYISGICVINYSNLTHCVNKGALTATSNKGLIYCGGINSINYSVIDKCLNKADLTALSSNGIIYCGGVNAFSTYYQNTQENLVYLPVIKNCGVEGNINATTTQDSIYVFAGGISGRFSGRWDFNNCGSLINCYSISTFTNGNSAEKYFIGTFVGLTDVSSLFGTSYYGLTLNNIAVLNQANITYQIGSLVSGSSIYNGINLEGTTISFDTAEQIRQQGVYWSE
ncbi:MAG: hypothetical protein IJW32_01015 [Clostridia bacterium]|nr:hypothetical protein [Clostridia bacterium]